MRAGAVILGSLWVVAVGSVTAPAAERQASLQPLVDRLSAAEPSERAEAACQLGQKGKAAAPVLKPLVALLGDGSRVGPIECGMSPWLRKMIEAKPEDWRRFETSPGRESAKALARIGQPALAPLLSTLAAEGPVAKANAAYAIGELEPREGRAEALARLMLALKDDDAGVREACARALGEIEDPDAVPALLASVRDKVPAVRAASAWALGEIESPEAVEPLLGALQDEDKDVRQQAAWALGEIADPQAASPLAKALKDASPEVRRQAAWALGELRSER
jgi:HEAT repeat protein